ncbi:MAG: hypothetical protein H7Z17_05040, partial [Fuerstia sp.]|nr:hypothetical protein [Fuerstiella sp.]
MQSSMWKLLTVAGIIGIGTLMVLEVQSRLRTTPVTSEAAKVDNAPGTAQAGDTDVIPDATTDLDRMLAGTDTSDDPQFALNEPNAPEDTGAPVPPADDQTFVGVSPVNRTVRKDSLADENPFNRSFGSDSDPKTADSSAAVERHTDSSAAIQPVSFSGDSAPDKETKPTSTSSTQFFNGSGSQDVKAPASKSQPVSVAAPTPAKTVTPASAQTFSDGRTAANNPAVSGSQTDSGIPDLFMPEAVPEFGRPAEPATLRGNPATDEPLMEAPGFDGDSPNFDPKPEPTNPGIPGG